jgi:hypothetical protein
MFPKNQHLLEALTNGLWTRPSKMMTLPELTRLSCGLLGQLATGQLLKT